MILFHSCARDGKCNEKTYNPENTVIRSAHKNYADTVYHIWYITIGTVV